MFGFGHSATGKMPLNRKDYISQFTHVGHVHIVLHSARNATAISPLFSPRLPSSLSHFHVDFDSKGSLLLLFVGNNPIPNMCGPVE